MNSEKYPQAWSLFIEHARNIKGLGLGADYQIPNPDQSGDFIQANDPGVLFSKFNAAYQEHVDVGARVYNFINWLERIEGKK